MCSTLKTIPYSRRQQENNILNCVCGIHDLACGCKDPLKHVMMLIIEKAEPSNFTEEEKQKIKQCLGEDHTTTGDLTTHEEDIIENGDLDALFAAAGDDG